jgi:hypothetical protein
MTPLDPGPDTEWLVTATIALGHAAWGRIDAATAAAQFRSAVLRLYGAD